MEKRLVYNSVVCLICGEHLVSRHRHDFQRCSCENGAGNYTLGVSDSQRYNMLGNGWTVDVIAHIFNGMR